MAELPDTARTELDSGGEADDELRCALKQLPPRMRAAVVFRFFDGLDVAETAHALGCAEGTVKSQTARALDRLRATLGASPGRFGSLSGSLPASTTTTYR